MGTASLLLLCTAFSCAVIGPNLPAEKPVVPPPPAPEIADRGEDKLHKAYTEFTLASIHMAHRRYEKARAHLAEAMKSDPDSIYLNKRMAVLLNISPDILGSMTETITDQIAHLFSPKPFVLLDSLFIIIVFIVTNNQPIPHYKANVFKNFL